MPDESLLMLLDEVRGKTLRLLGSTGEEDARGRLPDYRIRSCGMPVMRTCCSSGLP